MAAAQKGTSTMVIEKLSLASAVALLYGVRVMVWEPLAGLVTNVCGTNAV